MLSESFLEELDIESKRILLCAALLPSVFSLDEIIATTKEQAIKTLRLFEILEGENVLNKDLELGVGFYRFSDLKLRSDIIKKADKNHLQTVAKSLVKFIDENENGIEKCITLAHIYIMSDLEIENTENVLIAADHYRSINKIDKAATCYSLILGKRFVPQSRLDKEVFIDATLGLAETRIHKIDLNEKISYMKVALQLATECNDKEREAKASIEYGRLLDKSQKNSKKARLLYQKGWDIAKNLGNKKLLKNMALKTADFLVWQGKIAEAIMRYEETIGNLEELPSDAATLRSCATLGWCYGVFGQTKRGLGLIKAVINKVNHSNLPQNENYAKVMAIMVLLDARLDLEAESYFKGIQCLQGEEHEFFVEWMLHKAMAYFHFTRSDFPECFESQKRAHEYSKKYGWVQVRGSWNIECIEGLEIEGLTNSVINLDNEIKISLEGSNIYIKGLALRYRSRKRLRMNCQKNSIYRDLKQSLEFLTQSGAHLEKAKTQIDFGRLLLEDLKDKDAKVLLEDAWKVTSQVNERLFPSELREYVNSIRPEERILKIMVGFGNTIGTIRNCQDLLDQIITQVMGFNLAEAGGIFLVEKDGEIKLSASRNMDVNLVESKKFWPTMKIIESVINTDQATIKRKGNYSEELGEQNAESGWILCQPIILKKEVLGVLYLENSRRGQAFNQQDLELLEPILIQVAISLDNVRAYEEIKRLRDRLKKETTLFRMEPVFSPQLNQIIGVSKPTRKLHNKMKKVAQTDSAVMITGETGVGKELVARGVHRLSRRLEGPFIPINPASISEGLVASEFFGHEKGAFTGATGKHLGRLEVAHCGTLFLDEVQSLPLEVQAKLIRALELKEFERVGGRETIKSDFRLISAANQPLEEIIEKGIFRADLFFRLNVFPIHIKPLRERRDDIPVLAMHFLDMHKRQYSKDIKGISYSDMKNLTDYDWPGNVRELKHIIERAVILSEKNILTLPNLQPQEQKIDQPADDDLSMAQIEKTHLIRALENCEGRVSGSKGAAQMLNLNPQTFHSRMRRLGIKKKISFY